MKRIGKAARCLVAAAIAMCTAVMPAEAKSKYTGFRTINGKDYWYENGVRQGMYGDPKNIWDSKYGIERGREIYDPKSDGWYWLDACYDGAAAKDKEVWMPYIYQEDLKTGENKQGKWVRYDDKGKMVKSAFYNVTNTTGWYFYDPTTGEMYKGRKRMLFPKEESSYYYFDEITGKLQMEAYQYPPGMKLMIDQGYADGLRTLSKVPALKYFTKLYTHPMTGRNIYGIFSFAEELEELSK